jgi:sugar-specific transcriptional regulator TrmB
MNKNMGIDELKNLGFSSHEAEIYLCLLGHGPIGGNSISKILKLNRTLVYHVLKQMQKKFMVSCSLKRPLFFLLFQYLPLLIIL